MNNPEYYRAEKVRRYFGAICDHNGNEVKEVERGLTGDCAQGGKHTWLILPYEEGQKEYLMCLKCFERSHF